MPHAVLEVMTRAREVFPQMEPQDRAIRAINPLGALVFTHVVFFSCNRNGDVAYSSQYHAAPSRPPVPTPPLDPAGDPP